MKILLFSFFYIYQSYLFSAVISIEVVPDSLYIGEIVKIHVTIDQLKINETPSFIDIDNNNHKYSLINQIFRNNSVIYEIQIWDNDVIIPSIKVDIKNNNIFSYRLESKQIKIPIISTIDIKNQNFRPIKLMQTTILQHPYYKIFYYLIILFSFLILLYCWRFKISTKIIKRYKKTQNIFKKTNKAIDELEIPNNLNLLNVEKFYVNLSLICRKYIKNKLFIRATEMTSPQLNKYFEHENYNEKILLQWNKISRLSDMAKYAAKIPEINELNNNKIDFMNFIKLLEENI